MTIEQAHELANVVIKGEGGAVGITEDPFALRWWMIAGPEVSRLVTEYEESVEPNEVSSDLKHVEQRQKSQITLMEQVNKLHTVIQEMGSPFQEESDELLSLDTNIVTQSNAAEAIATYHLDGRLRFSKFISVLDSDEKSSL